MTVKWMVGVATCISLAFSKGWSEEMPPKSLHQLHSHQLHQIITGLPQCGHRIIAIENASHPGAIVPRSRLFGKTYRLSIQALPTTLISKLWTKWLPGFGWNTVSIPLI